MSVESMPGGAPTRRRVGARLGLSVLALLLLSVAAGWAWQLWAEPGRWEVTEAGVVLTQQAAQGQFGVEVLFVGIGALVCLLWAGVAGALCRDGGWVLAPVFAVAALGASLLAWQVGLALGPPDPTTVTGVSLGDTFPDQITVDSAVSFLVWPIAALGGLVLGLVTTVDARRSRGPADAETHGTDA
ncbi:hypothetical protein ACHAAC_04905 [Aeromicrobium sp. CF4.19]|uniref:hypothetical protein n=1 Tax=Aeromicrobium sp. CF4.19 TaxID=3373082 RepID=UPI003EE74D96